MLSDVLSDAIYQIHQYQVDYSDIYDTRQAEIEKVKLVMYALQLFYDLPPNGEPPYETEHMKRIIKSIQSLDISGILKAIESLKSGC